MQQVRPEKWLGSALALALTACSLAAAPSAPSVDASPAGRALKIVPPPGGGIYLGGYDWQGGVAALESALGHPVLLYGGRCAGDGGTENTLPRIDISCREARFQQGILSTYGIESTWFAAQPVFTIQGVIDGAIDGELRAVARDIAQWGRPLFWLYQREPEGQWGGYGPTGQLHQRGDCAAATDDAVRRNDPCNFNQFGDPSVLDGPERYVAFHRRVHDVVEAEIARLGLRSNITWVMGAPLYGPPGHYTGHYPGDAYVDWHAFDFYTGTDTEQGNSSCISFPTQSLWGEAMALAPQKPVMLVEFGVGQGSPGVNCGDRTAWFRSFFDATASTYSQLGAFFYWQMPGGLFPTRIEPGDPAAATWRSELGTRPSRWPSCTFLSDGARACR